MAKETPEDEYDMELLLEVHKLLKNAKVPLEDRVWIDKDGEIHYAQN